MKRRFLVIVHAGDQSLHPQWLAAAQARSWDLVVHYHGTNPHRFPSDGDGMIRIDGAGPKWPALARLLAQTREVWKGYDFVWLPDDDLGISGDGIDRMFALMAGLDLHLAQPAMAWTSPVSDVLTLHNPRFAVRYSSFVDAGAVALSTSLLQRVLPTLSESASGTALGDLWAQKLDTPATQCAILDCVQVTRAASGAQHPAARSDGAAETERLLQRHGIAGPVRLSYGGLDADGRRTTLFDRNNGDFLLQLCEGYRRLAGVSQQQLGLISEQHARARDDFLKGSTPSAASAAAPARPPRVDLPGNDALGLPPDYRSRTAPVYFDDDGATSDPSGQVWQPDVYALVAAIATASGARRVVDIGCGRADKLMALAGRFETVGVDFGANLDDCRRRHPAAQWLKMDLEHVEPGDIAPLVDAATVVVCSDVIEHVVDPRPLARALAALVGRAAAVVISTPERVLTRGAADRGPPANQCHVREWDLDEFADFLGRCGFRGLDFHGLTRSTTAREEWFTIVSVVGGAGARAALAEATERAALRGRNYPIVKALARQQSMAPVQAAAALTPLSPTSPTSAAPRVSASPPPRRFLALFRAGPKSLHPHAVAGLAAQNFDYALSYFGDHAPDADGAIFAHRADGAKWPGLEKTLVAYRDTIARYEYVWLPDDDLLCDPAAISRMFMVCSDLKLDLAQPALTSDSYYTHLVTLEHKAFQLRFTNFVEIMAPLFSAAFLARIVPTLSGNLSGWGLDALWPRMSRLGRVAIIDATPVKHTRPTCKGNYPANVAAGVPAHVEDWLTAAASFIETQPDFHINLGGLLSDGQSIAIGATGEQINTFLGHLMASLDAMQQKVPPLYFARYMANHLSYWQGGELGRPRYPRETVRAVLDQTLAPLGIAFPRPQAAVASPT